MQSKYTVLLISLLSSILVIPFFEESSWARFIIFAMMIITLLIIIITLKNTRHNIIGFKMLGVTLIGVHIIATMKSETYFDALSILLFSIFCISAIVAFYREIISTKIITRDIVVGSVCIYLLIGIFFGACYALIQTFVPYSFVITNNASVSPNTFDYFYYSFITLTTTGFGDIIPANDIGKAVVILESITGIFFIATFVANLIAHYKQDRDAR